MVEHILYSGPAGNGRLVVVAKPGRILAGYPVWPWLVQFTRHGQRGKQLDQCAVWLPALNAWDRYRWSPVGHRLVSPAILATVEAWLRSRPVEEVK